MKREKRLAHILKTMLPCSDMINDGLISYRLFPAQCVDREEGHRPGGPALGSFPCGDWTQHKRSSVRSFVIGRDTQSALTSNNVAIVVAVTEAALKAAEARDP